MKYKVVIFDLDGTLLNTLEDLKNAVNYALIANEFPKRSLEEIKNFIGNGTKVLINRALPYPVDELTYAQVYQDFVTYYLAHLNDHTTPYDDILLLLKNLKDKQYQTAIISNKNNDATKDMKEKYFGSLIDIALGTRDFSKTKPNPESTLEIIEALHANKNDCVFVGDSDVDILTAKNAGIDYISVSWGFKSKEFLIEHGAQIVIDSPLELLKHI